VIPEFIASQGRELPLILLLVALLGFRLRVTPRVSLLVKATPEKIFTLLDFNEGEEQRWQRTKVTTRLVDAASRTFRLHFATPLATGAVQSTTADFRLAERQPPHLLDIVRADLAGKSEINQLLRMRYEFAAKGNATRLTLSYWWGPRALLAQLLARADLWGSAYRIKGLAETGTPDFGADARISAIMAAVTGIMTLAAFAYAFGSALAFLLVVALFIQEFGHLLAYRIIGQPWGRMVFLPFIGAVAVPRIGFTSQAQLVFSALMGPGFSVIAALLAALLATAFDPPLELAVAFGLVVVALNLFNLLPLEPLDGGVALRCIMERVAGGLPGPASSPWRSLP
jgi:Zn-dependent protease